VVERREVVHLEEPRPKLSVKHNIKAEKLVAEVWLSRLGGAIIVLELRLHSDYGLYHNVFDLGPELLRRLSNESPSWVLAP
jgi:hypothetical protein